MTSIEARLEMDRIVIAKLNEAVKMFDLDLDPCDVEIDYNLKGRTGGIAGVRYNEYGERVYYLRFSAEGVMKHREYMVNIVVPHEIAHLVAYNKPSLGAKHHNRVWSKIDRMLGGNGKRTHAMPLTKARKTTWYIYEVAGERVKLSKIRHNRMVSGKMSYSYILNNRKYRISVEQWTGETIAA